MYRYTVKTVGLRLCGRTTGLHVDAILGAKYSCSGPLGDDMARARAPLSAGIALLLCFSLTIMTVPADAAVGLGTIVSAQHAFVDTAAASVGTTVFSGDKLSTDTGGNLQVRTGAARLLLLAASRAVWSGQAGSPGATVTGGPAAISTTNAKAFALRAGT